MGVTLGGRGKGLNVVFKMASNSQPSFSMRAVIFGIKKTFPRVSGIENSELIGNDKERILYLVCKLCDY